MPDREKVIQKLQYALENAEEDGKIYAEIRRPVLFDAITLLKEQERKKGSWDYGTQCSVCKGTIIPPKDRKVRVNFCPWCGADMRDSYEQEGGEKDG